MRRDTEPPIRDRGAWIVETMLVALVFLLVGKFEGVPITPFSLVVMLVIACGVVLGVQFVQRRLADKKGPEAGPD